MKDLRSSADPQLAKPAEENNFEFPYEADVEEDMQDMDEFSSDELLSVIEKDDEEDHRSPDARMWCNSNSYLFKKNDWKAIYQNLLRLGQIEQSPIWNDAKSLSLAQFAVSKLASSLLSIRKWTPLEKKRSSEYRNCFLKLVDRTIMLRPAEDKYRSSKAYFYYMHYLSPHHEDTDYQDACLLLKDLSLSPSTRFKDAQRYIHLRQKKWEGYNHRNDAELEELSIEYDTLIDVFSTLNQREQDRCQRNFMSCEYNYAKINADLLWKETLTPYFSTLSPWENEAKLREWRDKDSDANKHRKSVIQKCHRYLDDVSQKIPQSDTVESVQNKNKVRFIEIDYRKAQLFNIQGMLCFIVGVPPEKNPYFSQSSDLLKLSFENVDSLRRQNASFNYPWYSICPYAFAEFACGRFETASSLLLSVPKEVKPYGYYISARNLLDRMLPYFPIELLFRRKVESLHGVMKSPITDEMRRSLESIGVKPDEIKSYRVKSQYASAEPIGYSDFLNIISEIYCDFINKQEYNVKQESIKVLRSVISEYVHYIPEHEHLLTSSKDRLNAMYYCCVKKMMTPAKKRAPIAQYKINISCSDIFKEEMIASLS